MSAMPICFAFSNVFPSSYAAYVFLICPEIGATYAKNILRTLLYIPTVWAYVRYLRPTVREISGAKKENLVFHLFGFHTVYICFLLFLTVCHAGYDHVAQYLPLFAIVVILYCSVLWVIFGTIRYMLTENRMELVSQNMEYLQGQLKIARENELFAKTIRHDFRHHNQNIAAMLKKGDIQDALHYIEQYNDSLDAAKPKDFCPHVTVNAILNAFYTKTQNDGISVSISADTQGGDSHSRHGFCRNPLQPFGKCHQRL
ncbi:MAG: hypothetical protein ACLR23_23780 [Clostridia bacterium]